MFVFLSYFEFARDLRDRSFVRQIKRVRGSKINGNVLGNRDAANVKKQFDC